MILRLYRRHPIANYIFFEWNWSPQDKQRYHDDGGVSVELHQLKSSQVIILLLGQRLYNQGFDSTASSWILAPHLTPSTLLSYRGHLWTR